MLPKEIACNRISLEPNVLIFGSNSTYTSRLIQWIYGLKPGLITSFARISIATGFFCATRFVGESVNLPKKLMADFMTERAPNEWTFLHTAGGSLFGSVRELIVLVQLGWIFRKIFPFPPSDFRL